jgi:hypothetical protein
MKKAEEKDEDKVLFIFKGKKVWLNANMEKKMTFIDVLSVKLAACDLIGNIYGVHVNMYSLMTAHKEKIMFNRWFRNSLLFITLPKYNKQWRNFGKN